MEVARYLTRAELGQVSGAVVTIDVLRAFTTAAYAFAAGAHEIFLVGTIAEALAFKARHPAVLAMGEEAGLRPPGFDLTNSPVHAAQASLSGRTLVHRTSAGTQGVLAARTATRQWCASLVCASATARAVRASGLGAPVYVITGRVTEVDGTTVHNGDDDEVAARCIERARLGLPIDAPATVAELMATESVRRVRALDPEHAHPLDVEYASRVDAFDFAMEVSQTPLGMRLVRVQA